MYCVNKPSVAFSDVPAFKVSSDWIPYINDVLLEMYLSEIKDQILNINEKGHNYPNLTKDEQDALNSLIKDTDIVIKPADTGSTFVAWDKEDYLHEHKSQLKGNVRNF